MRYSHLTVSVLLHAAALFLVIGIKDSLLDSVGNGNGASDATSESETGIGTNTDSGSTRIIDKPVEITKVDPKQLNEAMAQQDVAMQMEEIRKKVIQQSEAAKCEHWYGGIGIRVDPYNKSISSTHQDYPASEAGLMAGDVIVSDYDDIRGEIGSILKISVLREGKLLTFLIVRGKICIE